VDEGWINLGSENVVIENSVVRDVIGAVSDSENAMMRGD